MGNFSAGRGACQTSPVCRAARLSGSLFAYGSRFPACYDARAPSFQSFIYFSHGAGDFAAVGRCNLVQGRT
eukprot:660725-Alexandrium_andersonii.AAC.1